MRQQFIHVLFSEAAWICELQSLPLPKLDTAAGTIDALRHMKKSVTGATITYLDSMSEHALNSKLDRYPVSWIGPQRTPGFILLHLITHGFHHKGQIVAMLRLLGYPAPDTDMQRA